MSFNRNKPTVKHISSAERKHCFSRRNHLHGLFPPKKCTKTTNESKATHFHFSLPKINLIPFLYFLLLNETLAETHLNFVCFSVGLGADSKQYAFSGIEPSGYLESIIKNSPCDIILNRDKPCEVASVKFLVSDKDWRHTITPTLRNPLADDITTALSCMQVYLEQINSERNMHSGEVALCIFMVMTFLDAMNSHYNQSPSLLRSSAKILYRASLDCLGYFATRYLGQERAGYLSIVAETVLESSAMTPVAGRNYGAMNNV